MESKSLYTILGIRPDASADQIEHAYAEVLHQLNARAEANPGGDERIRLVAAKEAYDVLSNPNSRQVYNQKLFAPQTIGKAADISTAPANSFGLIKLLAGGAIIIAAIWVYNSNAIEKEKLRIQHDNEVLAAQMQLEREAREQADARRQEQLALQQDRDKEAQERMRRESAARESRELDYRLEQQARQQQREARDLEYQKQREAREKQYQQQQQEARERQQRYEAERQIEREKQAVRRLQLENRGNSAYY